MISQSSLKSSKAKEFFQTKNFNGIYLYDWLLQGAKPHKNNSDYYNCMHTTPSFIFMNADLHLTLNKMVTKQNAMVDGKYKNARLYLFETPGLYIASACETGDRGSGWYYLDKENLSSKKISHYTDEILHLSPSKAKELSDFMREMCWNLLDKNLDYQKDYINHEKYEDFLNDLENQFGKLNKKIKLKY